ncbi:MAG TPA: hypothetical protein VGD43_09580 [Micromonospora sp.]
MTYYLLVFGELLRDRLASALAAMVSLPVDAVDIGDRGDSDRNWSAPVICTVEPVAGAPRWLLDLYLGEMICPPPTEPIVATLLAHHLGTVVAYQGTEPQPSAHWLVGPDGRRTRARIFEEDYDDSSSEEPVYRIDAVERPLAALPGLRVAAIPEVIRENRMPTPITGQIKVVLEPWSGPDTLSERAAWYARTRLGAWEGMVARMAAGWPPDGWYPAVYYREDLETRDELAGAGQTLPKEVRAPFAEALAEVDKRFVALTEDDGGAALTAELGPGHVIPADPERWWWRRISYPVPWRDQPAPLDSR